MGHAALVVKTISRSRGQSAVASAAYRSGDDLTDERTGKRFNYTRKQRIEAFGIEVPQDAPDWTRNRGELWNRAEAAERRKDSQVAREVLLVLPRELDTKQSAELVRGFAHDAFVSKGMVADWAIHAPDATDGGKNLHAHIMLTMRRLDGDDFGPKERDWNSKAMVAEWRSLFEEHSNRHLAAAGSAYRVDLRSNKEKGIDRAPQPKAGLAWNRLKRKAAWEAKRFDNPLRPDNVIEDIQEKYFEAMWGREWAWEGYDPMLDPERL